MKKESKTNIIKIIILFITYLCYTNIINFLLRTIGINGDVVILFIADLIFLIGIIFMYKDKLKQDYEILKKEYSSKKKIGIVLLGIIILFLVNMLMGMITEIFLPNISTGNDDNSNAIIELFNTSYMYTLFKTLLFAPIAEELLFKQTIRNVVKNNILFILISSTIYTIMNFMYTSIDSIYLIVDVIGYFLFSSILSVIYIKNNDNIILVMLIKLFYNIIPTILLLLSMVMI